MASRAQRDEKIIDTVNKKKLEFYSFDRVLKFFEDLDILSKIENREATILCPSAITTDTYTTEDGFKIPFNTRCLVIYEYASNSPPTFECLFWNAADECTDVFRDFGIDTPCIGKLVELPCSMLKLNPLRITQIWNLTRTGTIKQCYIARY